MDPDKLGQLNALANGGTTGLQQYNQASQAAAQAQGQAVAAAGNFGAPAYNTSAELRSALGSTASQYSQPGVGAANAVSAAAPQLAALDTAAGSNYLANERQNIQANLGAAREKLRLQSEQEKADQANQLAELRLKSQQAEEEQQFNLGKLGLQEQAELRSPERIAGQALADQQEAAKQGAGGFAGIGSSLQHQIRQGMQEKLQGQVGQRADLEKQIGQLTQAQQQAQAGPTVQNPDVAGQVAQVAQARIAAERQAQLDAAQKQLAGLPDERAIASKTQALSRADEQQQGQAALAQQRAVQAHQDQLDLPKFLYQSAVERGMDPQIAAGKYLTGEQDYIYQQGQKEYARQAQEDTLAARATDLDARQQRQQDTEDANRIGQDTGFSPQALLNARTSTRLPFDKIKDLVTSDEFKVVQEKAARRGEQMTDPDTGKPAINPDTGQPILFGYKDFTDELIKLEREGKITHDLSNVAGYLFQPDFHVVNAALGSNTQTDPFAAQAFGVG
jgi:hypothetical protein